MQQSKKRERNTTDIIKKITVMKQSKEKQGKQQENHEAFLLREINTVCVEDHGYLFWTVCGTGQTL